MANCQHPTGLCAECGDENNEHGMDGDDFSYHCFGDNCAGLRPAPRPDFPGQMSVAHQQHPFTPAVCGKELECERCFRGVYHSEHINWRCPEHGDETP